MPHFIQLQVISISFDERLLQGLKTVEDPFGNTSSSNSGYKTSEEAERSGPFKNCIKNKFQFPARNNTAKHDAEKLLCVENGAHRVGGQ